MKNCDIDRVIVIKRVPHLWESARHRGSQTLLLPKLLRRELPHEKKQDVFAIIDKLSSQMKC